MTGRDRSGNFAKVTTPGGTGLDMALKARLPTTVDILFGLDLRK